jgi:hypothetical protein
VKSGVFFAVRTEYLNVVWTRFEFKALKARNFFLFLYYTALDLDAQVCETDLGVASRCLDEVGRKAGMLQNCLGS